MFIYNDVYAVCNYLEKGDVFCFEIYNKNLVQMQRELFENLWKQAREMRITDPRGGAEVVLI